MITLSACPVCESRSIRHAFTAPTTRPIDNEVWRVDECAECGHQFMNPQPSWDDLAPYYSSQYSAYKPAHGVESDEAEVERAKRTGRYRHIAIKPGDKILDFGSGGGSFIRIAGKLGVIAKGVEPSEYAARVAKDQGLDVFAGTLEQFAQQTDERFDVITANHVVEHVPNPVQTLKTMKGLLKPGGMIWIAVPNGAYQLNQAIKGRWHATDVPYHLMQFSPRSVALAGEMAGLSLRNQKTESPPTIVASSIGLYLRYRWLIPRRLQPKALLSAVAKMYAARVDSESRGEAIISEFVAK